MNRQKMSSILQELEAELSDGNNLDEYHRQKAQALAEYIQTMLEKADDQLTGDEFLLKKMRESIDDFEVNHPKITNIVGRVSDLLSGGGV
jgi:hypothetical protein